MHSRKRAERGAPVALSPPATSHVADTAWSQNWLPLFGGGIASPQRDVVYRIPAYYGRVTLQLSGNANNDYVLLAVVLDACSMYANILEFVEIIPGGSVTMNVPFSVWNDLFVVVTGDPAGYVYGHGAYTVNAAYVPY